MLSSGFFNARNHDKQYYASDLSRLFNALITDGIFMNIGKHLTARAGDGMSVIIQSGMSYFNSTWTLNDSDYIVEINPVPYVSGFKRIDGIFLRSFPVTSTVYRDNEIYYMKGNEVSENPEKPVPTPENNEVFIPLCYVTVSHNDTSISQSNIINAVGTSEAPFVTGVLETIDATELISQWESQWNEWLQNKNYDYEAWFANKTESFNSWFESLRVILDGDVAGHLQNEIDEINEEIDDIHPRIITNLLNPISGTNTSAGITCTNNGDGTYTLNGTKTSDVKQNFFPLPSGYGYDVKDGVTYRLCGCPKNGSPRTHVLIAEGELGASYKKTYAYDYGDGCVFTIPKADIDAGYKLRITITIHGDAGTTLNNLTFKPMLTTDLSATYDDFVPYSGDGDLNDNVAEHENKLTQLNRNLLNRVAKFNGTYDSNTYVPVDQLAYDPTNKKLGLKVNGADSVIPFSSEANGTLKITGKLGSGTGYDGLSWSYSTVNITITIVEGVVTGQTISGNSVSSSAWSTSTNNHYGKASFSISSVEWIPAK